MDSGHSPQSPRWFWIALICSGVGLFDATQTVTVMHAQGMHHAWLRLFVVTLVSWVSWALVVPLVLFLGRRYPPTQVSRVATWSIHLTACVTVALVHSALPAGLEVLLNPLADSPPPGPFASVWNYRFYNGLLSYLLLYASVLAIGYILDSRERMVRQQTETARLNEQLSKAQLDSLRRQIEPALDDVTRELNSFRSTVHRAAAAASEGWRLLNDALGDGGPSLPYSGTRQTSPF